MENLGKGNRFFLNGREKVSLLLCFNGFLFLSFLSLGSANQGDWHLDGGNAWMVVI